MAIQHAAAGEVVDVRPLESELANRQTTTLVKTDALEIIRLVLPAGKEIPTHSAPGPLVVQCLEGCVSFSTMGREIDLEPGRLLHLEPGEPHALRAVENSSLLLTILLPRPAA